MHSRAHFCLRNFAVFELFFLFCYLNVAFADKSEKKEKKNLKCDLMVLKAVPKRHKLRPVNQRCRAQFMT